MLLLAILLLLLAAVGLVVAALVTGHIVLAWGSVGVSAVVAVVLLALRRRARRRRRKAAEADRDSALEEEQDDAPVDPQLGHTSAQPREPSRTAAAEEPDSATRGSEIRVSDEPRDHAAPADATASGADAAPDESAEPGEDPDAEPGEEDTDAADLLVVWEMPDEVLVVDEHPRYHLARCVWPDPARTERLPVREARELGFTPCAQCRPDASLARRLRVASAKQEDAASVGQEPVPTGSARNGVGSSAEAVPSDAGEER